jgi:hypothetical protein
MTQPSPSDFTANEFQAWEDPFAQARAAASPVNGATAVDLIRGYWYQYKTKKDRRALQQARDAKLALRKDLESKQHSEKVFQNALRSVSLLDFIDAP